MIFGAVALCVLAFGCSDGDEPSGARGEGGDEFKPCAYLDEKEVVEVTGLALIEDREVTSSEVCSFVLDSGPTGVNVQVLRASTPAEFTALEPVGAEVAPVDVAGADQALTWAESESESVQAGLVRVGGSAARLTIVWDKPPADSAAMTSLLASVAGRLPEADFEDVAAPGAVTCERVPLDTLREALKLPELQAAPAGSSTACAFSDAGSGVNLLVDLPEGAAGQEQLNLDGRTTTVDGKDYEWVVEAVPGVGDGALWTLDPLSERSGELLVLFGDQLVRVTSSANDPGEGIKERALVAARVAGEAADG